MAERLERGEKVRQGLDGSVMEVVAASERLAICNWQIDGQQREAVFEVASLSRVLVDQQPDDKKGDASSHRQEC